MAVILSSQYYYSMVWEGITARSGGDLGGNLELNTVKKFSSGADYPLIIHCSAVNAVLLSYQYLYWQKAAVASMTRQLRRRQSPSRPCS